MRLILLAPLIATSSLLATPTNVTLDLFSNTSFISKTFSLQKSGEIDLNIPKNLNLEDIRPTLSKGCIIQKQTLGKIEKNQNEELLKLLGNKANLTYELNALQAHSDLLKTLSLQEVQDTSSVAKLGDMLKNGLIHNAKESEKLSKELQELQKQIDAFPQKEFKPLHVTYTCTKDTGELSLRYPENARYQILHTLHAKTNDKAVNIETKAKILYQGEESYDSIDINLYSYTYNAFSAPRVFHPEYLGEKKQVRPLMKREVMADTMMANLAPKQRPSYTEGSTKSHFRVEGVNLQAKEQKLLDLDSQTLDAKFVNYIDAYGTNRAYTQVTFTPKKQYKSAINTLILDDMMIAKKRFPSFKKEKEVEVYFGENQHINIEKELIKTLAEKTFFGDGRIDTQNWKYTITNTKEYSEDIVFATRTPVSKDPNIVVKTTAQPDFDEKTAKGKTLWNFSLDAKGSKEIIFGYEVEKKED